MQGGRNAPGGCPSDGRGGPGQDSVSYQSLPPWEDPVAIADHWAQLGRRHVDAQLGIPPQTWHGHWGHRRLEMGSRPPANHRPSWSLHLPVHIFQGQ